jgi:hypothetical protein
MNTATLLREILTAADDLGIAPTTLCQRAVRHAGLIRRLEDGGSVTLATAEKLRRWIKTNRKRAA